MHLNEECCVVECGSIVQRGENGKLFRIINKHNNNIKVYIIDNCIIKGGEIRCDYLFELEKGDLYLVELKGVDHVHALRQIINTAELIGLQTYNKNKYSVIVGSANPKVKTTYQSELLKLANRFKKIGLSIPIKKNNVVAVSA